MNLRKTFILLTLLFVFCQIANSQAGSVENQSCNPEFARTLVEQQVQESGTVAETDKRIKIMIRAADFLWKFDEPAARKYLADAYKFAVERFEQFGFETDKQLGGKASKITTRIPDYRLAVVTEIAKKDPTWAKKLTEEILNEYDKSADERKKADQESREVGDLMRLAKESVENNPALSSYLFDRLMRLSARLLLVLHALRHCFEKSAFRRRALCETAAKLRRRNAAPSAFSLGLSVCRRPYARH